MAYPYSIVCIEMGIRSSFSFVSGLSVCYHSSDGVFLGGLFCAPLCPFVSSTSIAFVFSLLVQKVSSLSSSSVVTLDILTNLIKSKVISLLFS